MNDTSRLTRRPLLWFSACFLLLVLLVAVTTAAWATDRSAQMDPAATGSAAPLCRFGVNALQDSHSVDLAGLRAGWFIDFRASSPPYPAGMEYMPTIRLSPSLSSPGYTYQPNGSELLNLIAAYPGARWMIGNEPDSPYQDNLTPEIYARAYHELYHLIKDADPTARVVAGSIIQATEIRLIYLDMVLNSYHAQFGQPLPADGWSIHNYILPEVDPDEVDCSQLPCWGADIPPGVNRVVGEIWGLKDNDRVQVFIDRIVRFRQWLASRGYEGSPLYLTEYGILPPADFADENGEDFGPARVNEFMGKTFDYLLTATSPSLGDPSDGYRLVQNWSWYSTSDTAYNGTLFDPDTHQRTAIGDYYAAYTAGITDMVDFYPHRIGAAPPAPVSQGEAVTLTLRATIANAGNLAASDTATVRFYDDHPQQGGSQIGAAKTVNLVGCGARQVVSVQWPNVPPGAHDVYVQVTPAEPDTITGNNLGHGRVLVGTERVLLPVVSRALIPPAQ